MVDSSTQHTHNTSPAAGPPAALGPLPAGPMCRTRHEGLDAADSIHPISSVDGVVAMPQHPDTRTPSSYADVWTSSGGPRCTRVVGRACRALAYGKRWLAGGAHAQGPHVACAPSKTNQMHWYWIILVSLSVFDSAAAQATNQGQATPAPPSNSTC
eukprot:COSAG01_NODE_17063_length_1181_cov_2.605360_1_plen_155_part_01